MFQFAPFLRLLDLYLELYTSLPEPREPNLAKQGVQAQVTLVVGALLS